MFIGVIFNVKQPEVLSGFSNCRCEVKCITGWWNPTTVTWKYTQLNHVQLNTYVTKKTFYVTENLDESVLLRKILIKRALLSVPSKYRVYIKCL